MRVKCNQVVSDAIRAGRKKQKVTQARSAAAIGISRTKLALMEVDGTALGACPRIEHFPKPNHSAREV